MLIFSFIVVWIEIILILTTPSFPYIAQFCLFIWGIIFMQELERCIAKQKEQNA